MSRPRRLTLTRGSYWFDDAYPVTVSITSPVNGDAASTAEVDPSLLDAQDTPSPGGPAVPGDSRGVVGGEYVADYQAGEVVDYGTWSGGSTLIAVPGPGGGTSSPTGVALLPGAGTAEELFVVTADGMIAVWTNPGGFAVLPVGQAATTVVDNSASGADYEGVTTGTIPTANGGTEPVIYVANLASGKVETYDAQTFAPVDLGSGAFADPSLPAGYAPFNVQDVGGTVYVAYAEQSGTKGHAVDGAGLGFVDSFDATGHFVARFTTPGGFDAPSGIAPAPSDMGVYAGDLLVVNTGDGTISVLDPNDPTAAGPSLPGVLGRVAGAGGGPLVVPGLWGLTATTFHNDGSTYTYLYDSSGTAAAELGGFFYNPTLAVATAPPTTGIDGAPLFVDEYLGDPAPHTLSLGQFVDAGGAVDGSDAGRLSVTIDWGLGSGPTPATLTYESGRTSPRGPTTPSTARRPTRPRGPTRPRSPWRWRAGRAIPSSSR